MSSPWLPRDPAHPSLDVDAPAWTPTPSGAELLAEVIDGVLDVEVLTSSTGPRTGYFRVRTRVGPDLFVKVLDGAAAARQREAGQIARFVHARGVRTSPLLEGFPVPLPDGAYVLAYPLVNGRFSHRTEADLHQLGATIGRLHDVLSELPWSDAVRAAARDRHAFLQRVCRSVISGDKSASLPLGAGEALRRHMASLSALAEDGQVVHGDLNYTNVLFGRDTGPVTILDFEETLSAWFPPAADVAFAIERFALRSRDSTAIVLARALLDGYGETSELRPFRDGPGLVCLLRALNVRALAVLVARHQRGDDVPLSEWGKFVTLLEATEERRGVLVDIEVGP